MKIYQFGTLLLLLLISTGCSEKKKDLNNSETQAAKLNSSFFRDIGNVAPYNLKSPYSEQLKKCVYTNSDETSCKFKELPLIGMNHEKITIEDILNRTMISHAFLGENFKEFLTRFPKEALQLFGSVNAIVISDKINPSFYYSTSGAIYLSGRYFWRTKVEKNLVMQVKDYRSDFGSELPFTFFDGYLKDGKEITQRASGEVKTHEEIFFPVAKLIFHELTHANDYFPRSFYTDKLSFNEEQTYGEVSSHRYYNWKLISDIFPTSPSSAQMKRLAKLIFEGETVNEDDKNMAIYEIKEIFINDLASDLYSYVNPLEDLAMLTEEALSLYYFDHYKYITINPYPHADFMVPEDFDYPIYWAEVGRVLRPEIRPRAIFAIEKMMGSEFSSQVNQKLEQLSPKEYQENTTWNELIPND